jgi:hypothetical protein
MFPLSFEQFFGPIHLAWKIAAGKIIKIALLLFKFPPDFPDDEVEKSGVERDSPFDHQVKPELGVVRGRAVDFPGLVEVMPGYRYRQPKNRGQPWGQPWGQPGPGFSLFRLQSHAARPFQVGHLHLLPCRANLFACLVQSCQTFTTAANK